MSNCEVRRRTIVGEMTLSFPKRISDGISVGLITAELMITAYGVDVWYRLVDPTKRHTSYTADDILLLLDEHGGEETAVSVEPADPHPEGVGIATTTSRSPSVDFQLDLSSDDSDVPGPVARSTVPQNFHQAERLVRGRGLGQYRVAGLLTYMPKDSLCERDFKRPIDSFCARAIVVAHEKGMAKIWGKIGNQLESHNAPDIRTWWARASNREKAAALSSNKKLKLDELPESDLARLSSLVCPF